MTESKENLLFNTLKSELLRGLESLKKGSIPYNLDDILEEARKKHDQNAPINPYIIP